MYRPKYFDELNALRSRGELEATVRRCHAHCAEIRRRSDDTSLELAAVLEYLGDTYADNGEWCAGALETNKALQIYRTCSSLPLKDVVRVLSNLGCAYHCSGRPAEAEEQFAEALMLLDHLPNEDQQSRGPVFLNLAQLESKSGDLDSAEHFVLKAIHPLVHHFGWCNLQLSNAYCLLADIYDHTGRESAANRTMEKAVKLARWSCEEASTNLACTLSRRGLLFKRQGRIGESIAAQSEALAMITKVRKPDHYLVQRVKHRLADATAA